MIDLAIFEFNHVTNDNVIIIDIAVGAPFDGNGKVFVYYGSKKDGLVNSTVQQASVYCDGDDVIYNLCCCSGDHS